MTPTELRELLELAARAMGRPQYITPENQEPWPFPHKWNPLENDADGAEMEAALSITPMWNDKLCYVTALVEDGPLCREMFGGHANNKQAARRMASLRAAAEIGRGMKNA